ncbi:lysophospholipid acyltransferase family protein [Adhaeribacter radiodurans]|uniref:1-acyl-sn-glycerol-3-phosphate acyltransferase n=1 Tax=Adhaeribacter radiodurans TaxID=2745197 RepID=A0A7L7LC14_9BACT|nr:lysophospholipid acyltransferase family protein [Adhaeribacter radiodurans]QMU30075.1 1-acyl-sn-glycerol-3-phosphate acyltransferase [Adhaeribacter radiodurans]
MKLLVKLLRKIYAGWCVISFVVPFFLLYPFFVVLVQKPRWYRYAHWLNRFWSYLQLRLYGLPLQITHKAPLTKNTPYIYTPNHSSYIDIPLLLNSVPGYLNFVGKKSLAKVPLWGPIYNKLYISVDRNSAVSRAKSYIQSGRTLDQGRSVVIFPEGTIAENAGYEMLPFKDGPFKLAIEKKIPIVPVSMPYNHIFLPDVDGKFIVRWQPLKITFFEPIPTTDLTLADLEDLKNKVFTIIQADLSLHNHYEHRYTNDPEISTFSPSGI